MFLSDEETMKYVTVLTDNPSSDNIKSTIDHVRKLLPDDGSVDAEIELIVNAVEPVHAGIKERLHSIL